MTYKEWMFVICLIIAVVNTANLIFILRNR